MLLSHNDDVSRGDGVPMTAFSPMVLTPSLTRSGSVGAFVFSWIVSEAGHPYCLPPTVAGAGECDGLSCANHAAGR